MTVRPTLRWPHPCLRTPAAPVDGITDELRRLWDDMIDTMEAMPGVGLAAPQLGEAVRLCVVDASNERGQAIRLANPEITARSETLRRHAEASPNLPGVHAELDRPAEVTVAYLDETGARVERRFEGLWSTSVQHQIDHLNGMMFFDNLSRTKREMLIKRARKLKR